HHKLCIKAKARAVAASSNFSLDRRQQIKKARRARLTAQKSRPQSAAETSSSVKSAPAVRRQKAPRAHPTRKSLPVTSDRAERLSLGKRITVCKQHEQERKQSEAKSVSARVAFSQAHQ